MHEQIPTNFQTISHHIPPKRHSNKKFFPKSYRKKGVCFFLFPNFGVHNFPLDQKTTSPSFFQRPPTVDWPDPQSPKHPQELQPQQILPIATGWTYLSPPPGLEHLMWLRKEGKFYFSVHWFPRRKFEMDGWMEFGWVPWKFSGTSTWPWKLGFVFAFLLGGFFYRFGIPMGLIHHHRNHPPFKGEYVFELFPKHRVESQVQVKKPAN